MSADLRVDWCDYKAAKFAVEHWHYSRKMPHGSQAYIGIWENLHFVGAVCVGRSISPHIGTTYGLTQHQCAELTRIALRQHVTPVSQILSKVVEMIRKQYAGLRLLISFADSEKGHHGGVYQASNWFYVGESKVDQYLINGEWRNDTHVNRFVGRDKLKKRRSLAKYKYLYPLDRAMRKQIAPLARPYPKRETCGQSVEGDTSGDQPEEAGSIPAARSDLG